MRIYLVRYALRNGTAGELHVVASHGIDAIEIVRDLFGAAMCGASARPA